MFFVSLMRAVWFALWALCTDPDVQVVRIGTLVDGACMNLAYAVSFESIGLEIRHPMPCTTERK